MPVESHIVNLVACSIYNVHAASQEKKSFTLRHALVQNVPFILYNVAALSWVLSPFSRILNPSGQGSFSAFALLITFTFGKLGPRVILARLTKSPFPWFNIGAFGPLILGSLLVNLPLFGM